MPILSASGFIPLYVNHRHSCLRCLWILLFGYCSVLSSFVQASPKVQFEGYALPFVYHNSSAPTPTASFISAEGTKHSLAEYKGNVILVNLWATWCAACMQEMPELDALQNEFSTRNFKLLMLNQDLAGSSAVQHFLSARGYSNLSTDRDPGMQFGLVFGQTMLPTTLLFNAKGELMGQLIGPAAWNSPEAKRLIKQYLP